MQRKGREQGGREQGKMTHDFSGHCLTGSLEKRSKAASEAVVGPDHEGESRGNFIGGFPALTCFPLVTFHLPANHHCPLQLPTTIMGLPGYETWLFCQLSMPVVGQLIKF